MNVIVMGALPESLLNFRGDLLRALVASGCRVTALADDSASPAVISGLQGMGVDFVSFPVQRNGLNPVADLKTFLALRKIFAERKPDVVLAYTIKPIIWGGFALRVVAKARFYALVTGLGFAFQGQGLLRRLLSGLVTQLYKSALSRVDRVIFQNSDNRDEFVGHGIISADRCVVVHGSGVNIDNFSVAALPVGRKVFLSIGRLLGDKGFREYAQAARIVKEKYPDTVFRLLGPEDPSPDGIPLDEVNTWQQQGWLEYLGSTKDVRPFLVDCHVYVLPSYHEGMPRTVLEAMAIGRPVLTTDVPGCRETVVPGHNGWLVPHADAAALAERMIWFIENPGVLAQMGAGSRALAEERYDVRKVNITMFQAMGLEV